MILAAKKVKSLELKNVLIKGGHINSELIEDVLLTNKN